MMRSTLHNCFNLTVEEIDNTDLDKRRVIFLMLLEVVGSTPTRPIIINLVIYGINLSSFWVDVGQNPSIDLMHQEKEKNQ
jgi:hypothetical protein